MMAVDYLDTPVAFLAGLALGLIVAVFWLVVEPFSRRYKALEFYLDIMFSVEFVTLPIMLAAQASWKQPILSNLWYNFVMARVSTNPTTAHVTVYIGILLSYFVFQRVFYSNWKSALAVAILTFTHEGIWFVFAIPLGLTHGIWADLSYMAFLSVTLATYHLKYEINWKYFAYFALPILIYDLAWAWIGFPITVTSAGAKIMHPTPLWSDITTNSIEVFSWLIAIVFAFLWSYSVRDTGPRPPKLKFVIKRHW
jgi:hypothetical protein